MSKTIQVEKAPNFDLPFSHAVKCGDFVYVSGQVGVDPETLTIVGDGIKEQTEQCMKNIETILKSQGLTLEHIIKVNVVLENSKHSIKFNETYKNILEPPYPTRTTISGGLKSYLIEIDCIAYAKSKRSV